MKLAKRVLTALLATAVSASCVMMSVMATDAPVDVGNVEQVLEYYIYDDYAEDTFEEKALGQTNVIAPELDCPECGEPLVASRGKWVCAVPSYTNPTPYFVCLTPGCTFKSQKIQDVYPYTTFDFSGGIARCIHVDGKEEGTTPDGICDACGAVTCYHIDSASDGECDVCGLDVCRHTALDEHGKCTSCGIYWHTYKTTSASAKCTNCNNSTMTYKRATCNHKNFGTGSNATKCVDCKLTICNHVDNDGDMVCDYEACGAAIKSNNAISQKAEFVDIDGNKVLKVTDTSGEKISFNYLTSVYDAATDTWTAQNANNLVVSFRIKFENYKFYDQSVNTGIVIPEDFDPAIDKEPDVLNTGAKFQIILGGIKGNDGSSISAPFTFVEIDTSGANTFSYVKYDSSKEWIEDAFSVNNLQIVEGATTKLDQWYTVNAVFSFEKGTFNVDLIPDGGEAISTGEQSLGTLASASSVTLTLPANASYAGTTTYFDDIEVYAGTFLRDKDNKVEFATNAIIELAGFLKNDNVSASDKVRIAKVFDKLFNGDEGGAPYYTAADAAEGKETEIAAIIEEAKTSLINKTYETALIDYANAIADQSGYYARQDYCKNVVESYINLFDFGEMEESEILAAYPGVTDIDGIKVAKQMYADELTALENIRIHSEAFMELIKDFDETSRDYNYMTSQYNALSSFNLRDEVYKYECGGFTTVADANAVLATLEAKINAITETATAFVENVNIMSTADSFKQVYDAYVIALGIYGDNGVIDENLDNSTFAGLEEAIASYIAGIDAINVKIEQSEAFIATVKNANSSTYYVTILAELEKAAAYIDDDKENLNAEADYDGVAEATATYNNLRAKLEADEKNAKAYIAAVNAISAAQTFDAKKTAIESALALQEKGAVIGIEGVNEANITLFNAAAEIKSLEGYAKTLISAVANIESAKTLAERREYIFIAKSCVDKIDPSATDANAAKDKLATLVAAYDAEVEALNAAFAAIVNNASSASSATAPSTGAYKNTDIINTVTK